MSTDTLASKVSRIITGGFHSLIAVVENAAPELVMEQAIREVDHAIDEVRHELGKEIANRHLVTKRLMDENSKHEELSAQIELALKAGREDLAKVAVAKQLDIEAQIPVLEAAISGSSSREKEFETFIFALQAKKREMETELDEFKRSRQQLDSPAAPVEHGGASATSRAETASGAFNRVLSSQLGATLPGRTATSDTAELQELERMSRENRISERLSVIKSRVEQKS